MTERAEGAGVAARRVAIDALVRIERDDAYANLALGPILDRSGLDRRDRGLVTELVAGTLRQRRSCDFLVDRFLASDPPPVARAALRLGAYQLHLSDIPQHAAVSTTVSATPQRFRGLVNAVLRKVSSHPVTWPDDGTRLSYPDWLVTRLEADLGQPWATDALTAMNAAPEVHERADGYVQDVASQLVAASVPVGAGQAVWDACAAPGGKATAMAATGATVLASDVRAGRVLLLAGNVARLGLAATVPVLTADASSPPLRPGSLDAVLLDAPCSGLGVLHRRADARWRVTTDEVDRLAALQRRLLAAVLPTLRPGGVLVYAVCTLTRAESVDHDEWLADAHPELVALPLPEGPWRPWGRGGILLPQDLPSDGMCVFRWQVPSAP